MKKPLKIYDEMYRNTFYVYYDWNYNNFVNYLLNNCKIDISQEFETEGKCIFNKDNGNIHIYTNSKKIPILAHECLHAVHFAIKDIGGMNDMEEIYTYYLEFLLNKILTNKGGIYANKR